MHATVDATTVDAGGAATLNVKLSMLPGYRVMSNVPTRPEYFALRVKLHDKNGVVAGAAVFPPSVRAVSAGEEVSVYAGNVVVQVPITARADAERGRVDLDGDVRYQACTDKVCLFPVDARLKAVVVVR